MWIGAQPYSCLYNRARICHVMRRARGKSVGLLRQRRPRPFLPVAPKWGEMSGARSLCTQSSVYLYNRSDNNGQHHFVFLTSLQWDLGTAEFRLPPEFGSKNPLFIIGSGRMKVNATKVCLLSAFITIFTFWYFGKLIPCLGDHLMEKKHKNTKFRQVMHKHIAKINAASQLSRSQNICFITVRHQSCHTCRVDGPKGDNLCPTKQKDTRGLQG